MIPPRAPEPWPERIARLEAEFKANPTAPRFAKSLPRAGAIPTIAANESSPVDAVLLEWWCDSKSPDAWDRMWMEIIAGAVENGAKVYAYLNSNSLERPQETLAGCQNLLVQEHGIALDNVEFIQGVPTNAFWMRDFGPLFVRNREGGDLSIRDPHYYPNRPKDDAQPAEFAARIDVPVADFPLSFEGGNFLPNGGGLCIIGSVAVKANPQYSDKEIRKLFKVELGCEELIIVDSLQDFATGHVDMFLAWADRTTLIVGEYTQEQDATNRAIIEKNVDDKLTGLIDPDTGEEIELVRMPMPSNCPGGIHRQRGRLLPRDSGLEPDVANLLERPADQRQRPGPGLQAAQKA